MSAPAQASAPACPGTCTTCGAARSDRAETPPELAGWRFGWAAAGVFLVPLATAWLGAWRGGEDMTKQALGGVAGLAAGGALAAVGYRAARRLRRRGGSPRGPKKA